MPDKRRYWGTGAQLKDEELLPAATAEQRYVLPLQVAFHVASEPLATTLDSTFSSGMHPVCPALIVRSWSCAIGELSDVQPAAPGSTTASGRTRRRCGIMVTARPAAARRTANIHQATSAQDGAARAGHAHDSVSRPPQAWVRPYWRDSIQRDEERAGVPFHDYFPRSIAVGGYHDGAARRN